MDVKADLKWKNRSENAKEYDRLIAEGWKEINVDGTTVLITDIGKSKRKSSMDEKECIICKRKFRPTSNSRQKTCGYCRLVNRCHECGFLYAHKDPRVEKYCSPGCSTAGKNRVEKAGRSILPFGTTTHFPVPSHATAFITLDDISTVLEITALDTVIDDTMNKPGVWGLYDEHGILLDVHQTINITFEWKKLSKFAGRVSFTLMREDGVDLSKTTCKVIAFEDDLKKRLLIEQAFAIKYHAKYWNPQPWTFQMESVNNIEE